MTKHNAPMRNQESVGTRVTRRTITRGIAWTAPVVAVAAAAPAFASSQDCDPVVTFGDDACKCPGKGNDFTYYIQLCVDDSNCSGNNAGTFRILGVAKFNGTALTLSPNTCYPAVLPTAPAPLGTCSTQVLRFTGTNASNKLDVTVEITSSTGVKRTEVVTIATPPRDCAVTPNCPKCTQ